ncbi:MAG: hypothetical protein K2X44_00470 [Magnetospirillum sp.]|nr:hypothetical protein [Magnetospirillum sp.]
MSHQALAVDMPDIPPIRTSGALTYSFQEDKRADGQTSMQNTTTMTVNPSTYIYEPWFATTNGTINYSLSNSSGDSSAASTNWTGGVTINVLPQSDYATEFSATTFDRTIQLSEDTNDLTGYAIRLTTRLILPDDWHVQGRVTEDSASDSKNMGEVSHEYSLEVAKRWTEDLLRVTLEHRDSFYTGGTGGSGSGITNIDGLSVRHRSQPFESITTDGTSNYRVTHYAQQNYIEDATVMQGVSTAVWKPAEFKDITVNGAMRTFQQKSSVLRQAETTERASQTAFGTLSTSYVFEPRLVGNLGLNAGYTDDRTSSKGSSSEDLSISSISYGTNAGLDYSSPGEEWEGFQWSYFGGNSMDLGSNGELGLMWSDQTRGGHTLSRTLDLWLINAVSFSVSQSSGIGFNNQLGSQIPFNHSVNFTHSVREGKGWNVWALSGSDNRTFGGISPSTYELVNLQVTQGYDPDRFSSIAAAITFQASRQITSGQDTGFVDSVSGNITYRERFILGIENLNFSSDISFNPPSLLQGNRNRDFLGSSATSALDSQPQGNVFGTQRWTNRLDHTIGQLRSSLIGRINNETAGLSEMVLFQISRRF